MRFVVNTSLALLMVAGAGAALAEDKIESAVQETKTGAFDFLNKDTATVSFDKGSSAVTEGDRSDIKAVVAAVKSDAKIEKVIVAAWSDEEYPAGKGEKLSKGQRDLADARAKHVKDALTKDGIGKVEVYSMAEHPSWLARTFNTKSAKIKGEGKVRSTDDALIEEAGRELRQKGGPGKAVVFVLHAGETLSH